MVLQPGPEGRPETHVSTGYVLHSVGDISQDEPESSHSTQHTDFELLPGPLLPVPDSPTPSYRIVGCVIPRRQAVSTRSASLPSTTGSLPEYDELSDGPPRDHYYSNYVLPGMELQPDDGSYFVLAPFITDPAMPRCPGFLDRSCPVTEPHNEGPYFWDRLAPSRVLVDILARHRVDHVFEGSTPPPAVWIALLARINDQDTDESDSTLFRFRCWHCLEYRARLGVVPRERAGLDISRSLLHRRRNGQQNSESPAATGSQRNNLAPVTRNQDDHYQAYLNAQVEPRDDYSDFEIDWDAVSFTDRTGGGSHGPSTAYTGSNGQYSDNDSIISLVSDVPGGVNGLGELPSSDPYYHYGFAPPTEWPMPVPSVNLPPYPRCLSPLCPVLHPHAQGPYWDNEPIMTPFSLVSGPIAHLRDTHAYTAFLDALHDQGLGDLFSPETRPPRFILAAVDLILAGEQSPSSLELVERFRYFHCRGVREIVAPYEEIEDDEEDAERTSSPTLLRDSALSDDENLIDSDDVAQYFD